MSQEAKLTLFNVRQRASGPTDTQLSNSPQPAWATKQCSWTTLSYHSSPCFCIPGKLQDSISVCLEKGMGGWKHTYLGWGCYYLFPYTNRSAFMLKLKSNGNEKRHPMGKKVNILTCSTQLSPTSHRVPSDTGPASQLHIHTWTRSVLAGLLFFIKNKKEQEVRIKLFLWRYHQF